MQVSLWLQKGTIEMRLPIATISICLGCLFTGAHTDVSAPSAQQLHKLYGEPTMERFAVRSGTTLTVEYGPDHMACQLLIAPRQLLVEVQNPSPPMSSQGVSALLQELLPAATTGRQINSNTVQIDGNMLLKTDYENVSIRRTCASQSCVSSNQNQDFRTVVVFKRGACPTHIE
jgi:hypothetical protein